MSRRMALAALVAYLAVLAALTLGESPATALRWTTHALQDASGMDLITLRSVERVANILLFVPAGLLLSAALPRIPRLLVWALCVMASVGAELAQLALPGRETTVADVLMNATGAAIGILLHRALSTRRVSAG